MFIISLQRSSKSSTGTNGWGEILLVSVKLVLSFGVLSMYIVLKFSFPISMAAQLQKVVFTRRSWRNSSMSISLVISCSRMQKRSLLAIILPFSHIIALPAKTTSCVLSPNPQLEKTYPDKVLALCSRSMDFR